MIRLVISLLLLAFVFASAESKDMKLYDRIVMVVNGQPVLQSELELAMQWFGIKDKKEAAKKLIDQIIVAQAAEKSGLYVSPDEINDAILRIAKANRMESVEEFKKKMIQQNLSFTEFKDLIKRELLIQRYIQVHIRRVLFGGIKEGKELKMRRIRMIFLSSKSKDFEDKYSILKKNLTKENFEKMAKKYSDDPVTAPKGGLLGDVKKGDLIEKIDREIWKRKVGDIFEVPVKNGVYFIYIENEETRILNQQPSGEEIAQKLKNEYEIQLGKLREKATVVYLDKSLQ